VARNENGVTHYTEGTAVIKTYFANGNVCCKNCEFLYNDKGLGRCKCELQRGKIIPLDCIDGLDIGCPIKFEVATDTNVATKLKEGEIK
jgi:hypothetical protein